MKVLWKYCYTISFFLFFPLFFYPSHTYRIFFPFFFSSTHVPLHFSFFTSFYFLSLSLPPNSRTFQLSLSLLFFFFSLSTSSATPIQFFTLIYLILFFFSKFNRLQTGWFRSGRLDQSRANAEQTRSDQIEKCLQELICPLGETLQLLLQTSIIHPPQDGYKLHLKDFAIFWSFFVFHFEES